MTSSSRGRQREAGGKRWKRWRRERIAHWTKAYLASTIAWMHICIKISVSSPFQHKRTRVIAKKTSLRTPPTSYNIYTKWFWLILAGKVLVRAAWAQIGSIQNIFQALYWIWTQGAKGQIFFWDLIRAEWRQAAVTSWLLSSVAQLLCMRQPVAKYPQLTGKAHAAYFGNISPHSAVLYIKLWQLDNWTAPGFCLGHRCRL